MQKRKEKRGISLIVLVITIIVMIILAGAVILSLENEDIFGTAQNAVNKTNDRQVQQLAQVLWSEAYLEGKRTQTEIETYIKAGLKKNKIDLDKYVISVSTAGVAARDVMANEVTGASIPEQWQSSVTTIIDGVPIPKGFVASQATGENTKNGGLVIYEGIDAVTDSNVARARTTRNQYVWVPVSSELFTTKFVRKNFADNSSYSNTPGTGVWEVELNLETNMPLTTQKAAYVSDKTLAEVQAMYASVKKYGGFYIARYEAGIDEARTEDNGKLETKVYSVMNKVPYTYVPWSKTTSMKDDMGGLVEAARNMYPASNNNYGAASTLVYGVQWDATLQWWLDTSAVTSVTNSITYGNYANTSITSKTQLNDGAKVAVRSSSGSVGQYTDKDKMTYPRSGEWILSTGALKTAKVNNIYDMAGNLMEWTMEGYSSYTRIPRGGGIAFSHKDSSVAFRLEQWWNQSYANPINTFRSALYIK